MHQRVTADEVITGANHILGYKYPYNYRNTQNYAAKIEITCDISKFMRIFLESTSYGHSMMIISS